MLQSTYQLDDVEQQLDESNYQYWTVLQVSSWAYQQLQQKHRRGRNYHNDGTVSMSLQNYDSEDEYMQQRAIHKAILTLKKQRVDGASLSYLTLDHLLNFGIVFGVAVQLIKCLDELIPNDRRCEEAYDEEMANGKGEALLPSWYHQSSNTDTSNTHGETSIDAGGSQEGLEMSKRAQSVMKERFGMALPTLRGQEDTNIDEHDANNAEQYNREESMQSQQKYVNHNHFNDRGGITRSYDGTLMDNQEIPFQSSPLGQQNIDEILNAMPPHVRDIAERNPDLVSKLLLEKRRSQQQQQQQHKQHTLANRSSLFAVSEEGDEESALYQSEEDINIDQENVSLLRRRSNR